MNPGPELYIHKPKHMSYSFIVALNIYRSFEQEIQYISCAGEDSGGNMYRYFVLRLHRACRDREG